MTKSLFSQLDVIYVSSCSCYYSSLFLNRSRRGGGHRAQVRCSEFESHQSPQLFCNVVVEKNTNKQKEALGQWLWLSWQRGHFQHQRFMVRIHPSSNFYIEHLFTVNCNEKTKIKKKRPGKGRLFKKKNTSTIFCSHRTPSFFAFSERCRLQQHIVTAAINETQFMS